jgi:hypothetical protein
MRHKGAMSDTTREANHPFAVDVPIPSCGLRQDLNLIADRAREVGGNQWGYSTRLPSGKPEYWCRIGLLTADDADSLLLQFSHLGARRVR